MEDGSAGGSSAATPVRGGDRDIPSAPVYTQGPRLAWFQPTTRSPRETLPGPRAAHSCNLIGTKLWLFGGWNGRTGLNDLAMLDTETMDWTAPYTTGMCPSCVRRGVAR